MELLLDPAEGWKNLKLRVNASTYPDQQPSAVYPSSSESGSEGAAAARIAFEAGLTSAKAAFTLTSISELWVKSVAETAKASRGTS